MAVKATVVERESHFGPSGTVKAGDSLRKYKELTITDTVTGDHELALCIWDDGTLHIEAFSGWSDDGLSDDPTQFKPEDAPDVVMALTEFLGSL